MKNTKGILASDNARPTQKPKRVSSVWIGIFLISLMMNVEAGNPQNFPLYWGWETDYYQMGRTGLPAEYDNSFMGRCHGVWEVILSRQAPGCGGANLDKWDTYYYDALFTSDCEDVNFLNYAGVPYPVLMNIHIPEPTAMYSGETPFILAMNTWADWDDNPVICTNDNKTCTVYFVGDGSQKLCLDSEQWNVHGGNMRISLFMNEYHSYANHDTYQNYTIAAPPRWGGVGVQEDSYFNPSIAGITGGSVKKTWLFFGGDEVVLPTTTTSTLYTSTTTTTNPNEPIYSTFNVYGNVTGGKISDYATGKVMIYTCSNKNMCPLTIRDYQKGTGTFFEFCEMLTNGYILINSDGTFSKNNVQGSCQDIVAIYYDSLNGFYQTKISIQPGDGDKAIYFNLGIVANVTEPTYSVNISFRERGGMLLDNVTYAYTPKGGQLTYYSLGSGQYYAIKDFINSNDYFTISASRRGYKDSPPMTFHIDRLVGNRVEIALEKLGGGSSTQMWNLSGKITKNGTIDGLDGIEMTSTCQSGKEYTNSTGHYVFENALSNGTDCWIDLKDNDGNWWGNSKKLNALRNKVTDFIMYPVDVPVGTKKYTITAYEDGGMGKVTVPGASIKISNCGNYPAKIQGQNGGVSFTVTETSCDFHIECTKSQYVKGVSDIDSTDVSNFDYECIMQKISMGDNQLTVTAYNGKNKVITDGLGYAYLKDDMGNIYGQTYFDTYGKAYFVIKDSKSYTVYGNYNGTVKSIPFKTESEGGDLFYSMNFEGTGSTAKAQNFSDFIYDTILPLLEMIILIFTFGVLFKVLTSWTN